MERGSTVVTEQEFAIQERYLRDAETWLAEVLDGHMRTSFEFSFDGHEIYAQDGGKLGSVFADSCIEAQRNPQSIPDFEQRRRAIEFQEYQDMIHMMRGELPNTMVVVSDFPPELMNTSTDIGGYNTTRKQTMLRVIRKTDDGHLHIDSQTLDRSERQALEEIYESLGHTAASGELLGQRIHIELDGIEQEFLTDRLMGVYDRALAARYGGKWYAGRPKQSTDETYAFVRQQYDLVEAFVAAQLRDPSLAEDLRFGLAAAIETRFMARNIPNVLTVHNPTLYAINPYLEMEGAALWAQRTGKVYSGCGATVSAGPNSVEGQLSSLGYSDSDKKEDWKWKTGVCRVTGCPTRPSKTKVGPCQVCVCCQRLFDRGKDPLKEYKHRQLKAPYN